MPHSLWFRLLALTLGAFGSGCRPSEPDDKTTPTTDSVDSPTDTTSPPDDTGTPVDTGLPAVLGVTPYLADTDGGGGRVFVTVDSSERVTGVWLGDVALTEFRVDDATHVSGVPGPHAAGVVEVGLETSSGVNTSAAPFEYWTPAQIVGIEVYLDAGKGIADAEAAGVSTWEDQGPEGHLFAQATKGVRPIQVAEAFGSLPAVRFTPHQFVKLATPVEMPQGTSVFAVARWTSPTDVVPPPGSAGNVPLTIVGDGTSAYGAFGARGGQIECNYYVGGPILVDRGAALNDGVTRLIGCTYDTLTEAKVYVGNNQQGLDENTVPFIGLNTFDTIGAGYPGVDGWDGDLGAVVLVSGVLSVEDRTRLDLWSQQRWGTPPSTQLDSWTRHTLASMPMAPDEWYPRDGAQMVQLGSGRILFIGGWSPYDPWGREDGVGDRQTNEIWSSDDGGLTWQLLLAHDPAPPSSGAGARFAPGHTVGVTLHQGNAIVIGTDCNLPPYLGQVWRESDNGETWTLVSTEAPTEGRCLFMTGTLGEDLYVMGGQTSIYDEATAIADVWRSPDGGVTWEELGAPPWPARGMVYRPVEQDGKLVIVGGGRYDDTEPVAFNGVFAFDGTTWTTLLADGHTQWEATYYNAAAALNGRIWLFNGFTGTEELQRALHSDDGGATWMEFPGGSGGDASHADAVAATTGGVLRISGNLSERNVYAFTEE